MVRCMVHCMVHCTVHRIRRPTCAGMGPSAASPMASFALLSAVSIGVSGLRLSSLLMSLSFSAIGS